MQVRGQAGDHQVDGARVALGHAYGGAAVLRHVDRQLGQAPEHPDASGRAGHVVVGGQGLLIAGRP